MKSLARGLGFAVTAVALGGFLAMPVLAHPRNVHTPHKPHKGHPELNGGPTNVHKPHKGHPQLSPGPSNVHKPHKAHPELNGGPSNAHKPHKSHAAHKDEHGAIGGTGPN